MKNMLESIVETLNRLYPLGKIYFPIVEESSQLDEIQRLKGTVKYEQFYFVLNLVDRKIEFANGLREWLGYNDETFTIFDYIKIIHPRHFYSLNLSAKSAFESANSYKFRLKFMSQKVVLQIPLLHNNGKYYTVKRTLYPFQIDQDGQVLAYLNHFVVLKEYNEFDLLDLRIGNGEFLSSENENIDFKNNQLLNLKASKIMTTKFNEKELDILKLIANKPYIKMKEIAEILDKNLITIQKTDSKRILEKARTIFEIEEFSNLKEVAFYMKRDGLL
jgi:hypothetical protein